MFWIYADVCVHMPGCLTYLLNCTYKGVEQRYYYHQASHNSNKHWHRLKYFHTGRKFQALEIINGISISVCLIYFLGLHSAICLLVTFSHFIFQPNGYSQCRGRENHEIKRHIHLEHKVKSPHNRITSTAPKYVLGTLKFLYYTQI